MVNIAAPRSRRGVRAPALTQVELLMVLAAVGLGGAVVLPGLNSTSKSRDEAQCLNNLRQIAAASWQYSSEDPRDQLVPMHQVMVRTFGVSGFSIDPDGAPWSVHAAKPFSFGGQTPTVPFPDACGNAMMSPVDGGNGYWVTETRPLNKYVDAGGDGGIGTDPHVMEAFRCPADTGYPNDPYGVNECPPQAFGIPLYDMLGNSYRTSAIGLIWLYSYAQFTSGPWAHRASSLDGPLSETALYVEPLFYSYVRTAEAEQPLDFWGWHGQFMSDQIAYCDGSARMTRMDPIHQFSNLELGAMGYTPNFPGYWFLRRGPTWRLDVYPTPGALVQTFDDNGVPQLPFNPSSYHGWPFDGYQYNLPPE